MFNLTGHKGAITAITWRADSEMFASASEDGTVRFWKASDGSALRSLPAHPGGVLAARFAHDGRIVTCGRDHKIQIWDTTGKNLRTLPFTGDLPNRVTFTDDGNRVVGSDWKGNVLVWGARSGRNVGELDAAPPPVSERIAHAAERIAKLQLDVNKAMAAHTAVDTEAKATQAKVEQAKKALADARATLTVQGGAVIKASEQLANDPGNKAAEKELATARELVDAFPAKIAALQKEIGEAMQKAGAAAKKAAEAKLAVDESRNRLAAAKASLTKWQAALQNKPAKSGSGKVSQL